MRILLTGASSFTGYWFARELAANGHEVTATFRGFEKDYSGSRRERIERLSGSLNPIWNVEFGDQRFIDAALSKDYDIFLHHAAEMTDYRSWDFDTVGALAKNTRNGRLVLTRLAEKGCGKLLMTGSVFEPFEGVGDPQRRSFSPYGLSKHLTFEWFRLEAERLGVSLGKFVIPNPFGPLEEFRFTSYLAREWAAGRVPTVGTPLYIRDNIHVSLLAGLYAQLCASMPSGAGIVRSAPSGYVESQGAFAFRLARALRVRTSWSCDVAEADQRQFEEPLFRANDGPSARDWPAWSEDEAWDDLASFYTATFPA